MSDELLTTLLRDVSRSFYLTMRILPAAIRSQIGVAYLLARATDTVADTEILPVASRLGSMAQLREKILGNSSAPLDFGDLAGNQEKAADKILLQRVGDAVALVQTFVEDDQRRIRDVLKTIISGQELDLQRFGGANAEKIAALENDVELDDYTYRVAGCVGEFWTRTCRAWLFPTAQLDDDLLLRDGVRFGKGLQMVNILQDIPQDLRNGRCYIPRQALSAAGLTPEDLLSAANEPRFSALCNKYLDQAQEHLAAGWSYTNMLPRSHLRLHLGCAWPILIGVRTLQKMRRENVLIAGRRIKISREEVRGVRLRSILLYPWESRWKRLFDTEIKA